jgi:phage gp16-like protein
MSITSRQLALIKVAAKQVGMPDQEYRLMLVQFAGVTSATELDHAGFETVMGYFEWRGFKPLTQRGPSYGERPGMASFAQLELIRALWAEFTHGAYEGEGELNKWVLRCFKVSSLRFLTKEAAPKVITALKTMKARPRKAA